MIDRKGDGEKLDNRFERGLLANSLARLEGEDHDGHNVVATAQAAVAARIIAASGAGNACIGNVTGIQLRARYQKQEHGDDA